MEPRSADATKGSGAANVLSRSEIEVWKSVDYMAKRADKYAEAINAASRSWRAAQDHIGVLLKAGVTFHGHTRANGMG
jgi:hypothetical protein